MLFRRLAWVAGGFLLLAGLVHAWLRPLAVAPVLAGVLLPLLSAPVIFAALRRPIPALVARCVDDSYGGQGLAATALELHSRPELKPMERFVLDSAEQACAAWRAGPDRLPGPEPWPRAWMPLGLALAGIFLLLAGGQDNAAVIEAHSSATRESSSSAEASRPAARRPFESRLSKEARRGESAPQTAAGLKVASDSPGAEARPDAAWASRPDKSETKKQPSGEEGLSSAPSSPDAASPAGTGKAGAGQGGGKSAAAGSEADAEVRSGTVEDTRLDVRYADMQRRGGERSAGGHRELRPYGSTGRSGESKPAAHPPEQASGGAWNPPPAFRPYLNRYFQALARQERN